ncbi:MAG: hypothetical protein EB072_13410 [Betaproteobacteria bacterium]|nr:hypothetical protein [Betaproteobacteria bacterium]
MKKWARFVGNCAVEVIDFDPENRFHSSIIFEPVPCDVTPNSVREGNHWTIMRWDSSDEDRMALLKTNIENLQDDASATDRVSAYQDELTALQEKTKREHP